MLLFFHVDIAVEVFQIVAILFVFDYLSDSSLGYTVKPLGFSQADSDTAGLIVCSYAGDCRLYPLLSAAVSGIVKEYSADSSTRVLHGAGISFSTQSRR